MPQLNINVSESMMIFYVSKIAAAEKKRDEAALALSKIKRAARKDGIDLGVLKAVRKELETDASEQIAAFNTHGAYAHYLGHPLYKNFELFEIKESDGADVLERAYQAGYRGGILGVGELMNPHDATQPGGQEWLRGHRAGQSKLAESFKQFEDVPKAAERKASAKAAPKAEPKKRGRKPKAAQLVQTDIEEVAKAPAESVQEDATQH